MSLLLVNSAHADNTNLKVEIVKNSHQRWHFQNVRVIRYDSGLIVSGRINAQQPHGLPRGHVDVAAWSSDNKLVSETTSAYFPRLLTRRTSRKGGLRFSAKLPVLPEGARIKVAFHQDKRQKPRNPVHDQTVAR